MSFNASTTGLRVLRAILNMEIKQAGAELSKVQPFLTYDEDKKAYDFIRHHYQKYGAMPAPDTLLDQISVFLPPITEPYEFERDQLQNRFIEDAMRSASDIATALLQQGKAKDALSQMMAMLLPVTQGQGGYKLVDLRHTQALELYLSKLAGEKQEKKLGYPTLDKQGGIEDGDLLGIVGRPGSGKTWLMLFTALNYWSNYQEPVMFVTQEMSSTQIERRALPLIAGVDPTPLYLGEFHQHELGGDTHETYLAKLQGAKAALGQAECPFLIYDSKMAGTVADVQNIAAMHGVRRIWVDGAYMLRHPDLRLNRYMRVPENLDLIKQGSQRDGTAWITSWQFKKGAGKDSSTETDLDDIGYSHAIGEYLGVIMGLLENPKSITQMNKKHITIMKGRNGETGGFDIHWNFKQMEFNEITPEETSSDLVYL